MMEMKLKESIKKEEQMTTQLLIYERAEPINKKNILTGQ